MIELPYSLVIEATEEPDYFGFYSPELGGFSGIGHSVEDCLYQAKWAMKEHVELLVEQGLPVPPRNDSPTVLIQNSGLIPVDDDDARVALPRLDIDQSDGHRLQRLITNPLDP